MYIIDKIPVDATGRINLSKFFPNGIAPNEVGIAYDIENQTLVVVPYTKNQGLLRRKVDGKKRINLNSWMVKAFGDKIYLIVDDQGERLLKIIDFV